METLRQSKDDFCLLSELVLAERSSDSSTRVADTAQKLGSGQFEKLAQLAAKNHVVIRAFTRLVNVLREKGSARVADQVLVVLEKEDSRIHHAIGFLDHICGTLEQHGCPATVIKSLDHLPDLGSDLDLYTDADPEQVVDVMRTRLQAKVDDRSWGDRLANKWNFVVPGLPELVEIHIGRLGQTGEHTILAKSLSQRTRSLQIGQYHFRVLAPEDRIIVSTLQRMYRHFYIRLCDVIDNGRLVESEPVDFKYLHSVASAAGIWGGIATYLTIISGYIGTFRGRSLQLPSLVTGSAKFGVLQVHYRKDFLRVPIMPHSVNLYTGELRTLVMRGDVRNSLRLSLLPGLATAAALELKITGSDKGIW